MWFFCRGERLFARKRSWFESLPFTRKMGQTIGEVAMRRDSSVDARLGKNISRSEARRNVRGSDARSREEERNIRRNAACGKKLLESQSLPLAEASRTSCGQFRFAGEEQLQNERRIAGCRARLSKGVSKKTLPTASGPPARTGI